jgi:ribosomal-protein-alanine N-acetyltransferase
MAIVSHNIRLSPLQLADADAIFNCLGDKSISEYTLIPYPYTRQHADSWLSENFKFEEEHGYKKNYAIRNADDLLIGAIGIHFNYGTDTDKSEFGYWLGKPYRNKGVMTTAVLSFCELVRNEFGLKVLEAHVFDENIASQKVLTKAGFIQIEIIPRYEREGRIWRAIKYAKDLTANTILT